DDHKKINVEEEEKNEDSMLHFYKNLIQLRNDEPALHIGKYIPVLAEGNMLSYLREHGNKKFLIALNLGDSEEKCGPKLKTWSGKVRIATHKELYEKDVQNQVYLGPNQGVVVEIVSKEN